jgi:hypothetical protein
MNSQSSDKTIEYYDSSQTTIQYFEEDVDSFERFAFS